MYYELPRLLLAIVQLYVLVLDFRSSPPRRHSSLLASSAPHKIRSSSAATLRIAY